MKGLRNFIAYYQSLTTVLLISTLVFASGCAKKEVKEIKIGAVLPLTGDAAEYGTDQRNGILLAVNELNAERGPSEANIVVVFEDSRSSAVEGVAAFKKLLTENTIAILTTLSSVSMAIAPIAEKENVVLVSIAVHPELTEGRHYVIRMLPTSVLYSKELSHLIAERMNSPTIGILFPDDDFGYSLKNSFITGYESIGGDVIAVVSFEKEKMDYRSEVTKVIGRKPESLFLVGYGRELGLVVRQCRELGFKGKIYSTPEISYPDVSTVAGNAIEGIIFISMFLDESDPSVAAFQERYRAIYKKEPSLDSYLGYDEVMIINQAFILSKSSGKSLRDILFQIKDFPGLTGSLTVQPNGDVKFPLVFKTISNGKAVFWEE